MAAGAIAALCWYALPFSVPLPRALARSPEASPVLTDRNGLPLQDLALPDFSRSRPLEMEEIPADLIACTLAAEDKRFFQHGGVDILANLRAVRDLAMKRKITSGASTITQQLAKISSPPVDRDLRAKVREALIARRLEMTWTKERILTEYLNRLDYGNLRTGCAEASRFYFQKAPADLSLAECALLAGLPQAPSRLNPLRHPARAQRRRDTVLERLEENKALPEGRIAMAMKEAVVLRPVKAPRTAPWLAGFRRDGGGSLRTTIDLALQKDMEAIVREETAKLAAANLRHAAVVVMENATGEILALVSSASWDDPRGGQINGALSPRSPGSTLKPFTYLLALERNNRLPSSILADIPTPFRTEQGLDLPENYDRKYRGPVTLRSALACSLNVPAMRELSQMGGERVLADLLAELGVAIPAGSHGLGLTLGNAPVRLLDLTNAYATLARGGNWMPPVIFTGGATPPAVAVLDPIACHLISDILSDQTARAPSFPPGGPLDLPFRCAVKTGTSSDFHDNWCIGYTPDFTVGVWAGNFEQQPMKGISGVAGAGPVFHRAMQRLHRDRAPTWFSRPAGIVEITVDARTGKLVPPGAGPAKVRDLTTTARMPMPATSADYDAEGRALLDASYREWYGSRYNLRLPELALDAGRTATEPLRVITPADGATFLLDPEIPSGSDRLRPVTNLPGTAEWRSATLAIEPGAPEPVIRLRPGTHILTARDPRTGVERTVTIHVRSL